MIAQTFTIVGSLFAALALQTVWITHSLAQLATRITRIEDRLVSIETKVAKLEERTEHAR
jgi:cell division protein ZapA (FtsZ GTPase activity inhibitor)